MFYGTIARRCGRRSALTFANLFKFSLTTDDQDADVFLVLDPLPTDS